MKLTEKLKIGINPAHTHQEGEKRDSKCSASKNNYLQKVFHFVM
jgi:hypothetical protein